MPVVIREARDGELDAVARVLVAAFEPVRQPGQAPLSPEHRAALERYLEDLADVRSRLDARDTFVAHESGLIVGAGILHRPHHPPEYPTGGGRRARDPWPREWATLHLLAVAVEHRRRGIGRRLAEARIDRARALGAPVVALHTSSLFPASREMYRHLGWLRARAYDLYPAPDLCAEAYLLPLSSGA